MALNLEHCSKETAEHLNPEHCIEETELNIGNCLFTPAEPKRMVGDLGPAVPRGLQLYLRVWTPEQSFSNEYSILRNAILYSRAAGLPHLRARCRELTQSIRHTTYIVSRINHSTYIAEIKIIGDRVFCCSQKLR